MEYSRNKQGGVETSEQQQGLFPVTEWTVVLAARSDEVTRAQALETLCRAYWRPVHAWVRRSGKSREDAEDLTQAFFLKLLSQESVQRADRERGRFRSYLLVMLKGFLSDEWDKSRAQRRGGGQVAFSLDVESEAAREALETPGGESPDRVFDRRWALEVLEQARLKLGAECEAAGKGELFAALFSGAEAEERQSEIALRLGMTENAVKMSARRMRGRLQELIREVVARTVSSKQELDGEIRHLMEAVSS